MGKLGVAFVAVLLTCFLHRTLLVSARCRCLAFDRSCWPDARAWMAFNASVDGQLLVVRPPAWPCHDPHYDEQACEVARVKWANSYWRSNQPGAMMKSNWELDADNDQGCFINSTRSSVCYQGSVPVYAVNVTRTTHVQLAVKFASKHNLRLVTRNTGHDFLGRSTAKGALSIWLHHLKSMAFQDAFVPEKCGNNESEPAVTVGAGVQWNELYRAASQHNRVIVGGGDMTVGAAGGFPQGAGHSPVSRWYGLAADNILQYKVVTADGKLRTANKCQNRDLFWALRGGGGGTFGVVVEATQRTHPALVGIIFAFYNISTSARDTSSFEKLLVRFVELNPSLSDAGWSGYAGILRQSLVISLILPSQNMSLANHTLAPVLGFAKEIGLNVTGGHQQLASFEEYRLLAFCNGEVSCENVNGDGVTALASRLIPREVIQSSPAQLSKAFIQIADKFGGFLASLVAGGRASEQQDNAVNPAWRKATMLAVIAGTWWENATRAERQNIMDQLTSTNKLLVDLTPGSGTYMNEADYNEPEYKFSFYGPHYPRLYDIKQRVDPNGLFVCHHCVGSEDWSEDLNCKLVSAL